MKTTMTTMKTTLFVLLTAVSLTACAKADKAQVEAAAKTATPRAAATKAETKPVARVGRRMQLEPVAADKFVLARKD